METEFGKARAGGSSPAAIVSAAIRQVANLHKMKLAVEGGDSIEFAMKRGAPPVHFTREKAVGAALRAWTPPRLLRAMAQLADASLDMRRNSALAEAIAQRTLLVAGGERAEKRELRLSQRVPKFRVMPGLDPGIHDAAPVMKALRKFAFAEHHHGSPGQARR